jgi:hypothetical protein
MHARKVRKINGYVMENYILKKKEGRKEGSKEGGKKERKK